MRIAVLRSADRAGAFVTEIRNSGHIPVLCALIDFAFPENTTAIDRSLKRWLAREYDAAIFTSITTVRALKQRAIALSASGASVEWERPAGELISVGDPTKRALEAEGFEVDRMPSPEQSAAGILEMLSKEPIRNGGQRIYLPHANLADPKLEIGLKALGYEVDAVDAYHTVDAPADPTHRITAPLKVAMSGAGGVVLDDSITLEPQDFAEEVRSGRIEAVLLTSPSIARKFVELVGTVPPETRLVAIGKSTGAEATALGLTVAGIAERPDAASMLAQLETKNS
ncbi:uroporphyrinogen-III synthase [Neomicrococcus aestuarii]|uniref:Uroporphyrinogen-III synthase n=1 Tax=Neomicrococcus aestuarii TaxID=556325 RepID=A0A1L2ZKF7_9MICC|nr:uroporphyrinogen-III synthase [Neomicrococcus aestuarii]APF39677.1 hypothetical protein BHE16_00075 [Neomicrococcus aestuarii]